MHTGARNILRPRGNQWTPLARQRASFEAPTLLAAENASLHMTPSRPLPVRRVDRLAQRTRAAAQLSQIIADSGVHLAEAGPGKFKAQCPFHGDGVERTPSMAVDDERGSYFCYGCGAKGNVFDFVMEHDGLTFSEALGQLAKQLGVDGADSYAARVGSRTAVSPASRSVVVTPAQQRLAAVNEAAQHFFAASLRKPTAGACARGLLSRGVDAALADRFGLGYAPASGSALARHLVSQGFSAQEVVDAGLATQYENGNIIDRFRNRLMIPIADATGEVVAFGGRRVESADGDGGPGESGRNVGPKYLNSAESPIFSKGATLYGYHLAWRAARKEGALILVEGYMDAIALHAVGVTNAVACLGTALTEAQLTLASLPASSIVLCLDADTAGQIATIRLHERGILARLAGSVSAPAAEPDAAAADAAVTPPVQIRIASLPAGSLDPGTSHPRPAPKDPDEFLSAIRGAGWARGEAGASAAKRAAGAAAAAAAGADFRARVVEPAPLWLEWLGQCAVAPYLASRSSPDFSSSVEALVKLLDLERSPALRSLLVSNFARTLAFGDPNLASRYTLDLHEMIARLQTVTSPRVAAAARLPPFHGTGAARSPALPASLLDGRGPCGTDVAVHEIYVWSTAPTTLHWRDSCSHALNQPRPPAPSEFGLPLCPICANTAAFDAELRPDVVEDDAAPGRRGGGDEIEYAGPREQAELLLLHLLLQRPDAEFRQRAASRARQLAAARRAATRGVGGRGKAADAGLVLRTAARRTLFEFLTSPPSPHPSAVVWESFADRLADWEAAGGGVSRVIAMGAGSEAGGASIDAQQQATAANMMLELELLRRPSDSLNYTARQWATAAATGNRPDDEALLERCLSTILRQVQVDTLEAKLSLASASLDRLRRIVREARRGEVAEAGSGAALLSSAAAAAAAEVASLVLEIGDQTAELSRERN